jgi:putative transcriptional regulator
MPIYWTLKAAIKRAKTTPGALAASADLHRQSLYAILKQPRAERVDTATLAALCDALDCQPGDLLTYKR